MPRKAIWFCVPLAVSMLSAVVVSTEGSPAEASHSVKYDDVALTARVEELRRELLNLRDRQDIHDVYMRYMRGFDRNDTDLLRSAFWPDAQINYGVQHNSVDDFIVRHLKAHTSRLASWGHQITNETPDIVGDTAHVEVYVTGFFMAKDERGGRGGERSVIAGRYVDRLDRRDGHWRISVREFLPHFWTENESMESYARASEARGDCALGTWDKRDPSYRRPLTQSSDKNVGVVCAKK
jgi:hypothetical protein